MLSYVLKYGCVVCVICVHSGSYVFVFVLYVVVWFHVGSYVLLCWSYVFILCVIVGPLFIVKFVNMCVYVSYVCSYCVNVVVLCVCFMCSYVVVWLFICV